MKNILKTLIIVTVIFTAVLTSCKKYDFDAPKEDTFDNLDFAPNISVQDLIFKYASVEPTLIDSNLVIKGTVIGNDKSGNLYKQFIIQDSTETGSQTGLIISINEYESHNKYHVGDMVYIKCEGLYLGEYGGVIQLGSLFEGAIGRIEEPSIKLHIFNAPGGKAIVPKTVALSQIGATPVNTLIKLEDVQFKISELGETYADATNHVTTDQMITDCGGTVDAVLRTSGYSKFASELLPSGKGSVVVINGEYNGSEQLLLNSIDDVQFNDARCGAVYEKDFEEITFTDQGGSMIDGFISGNWTNYSVIGSLNWGIGTHSGNNYASITNYNYDISANEAAESWLISPSFNLTLLNTPILNFKNAKNYSGPNLEAKVSTDYTGSGDPSVATWTNFSPLLSSGNFTWVSSGDIDLDDYKTSSNVYIAFVYKGSDSTGATWEVDNIKISDN